MWSQDWPGLAAAGAAIATPLLWIGRKLFVVSATITRTEERLGSLEKKDMEHDTQLEKVNALLTRGLDRIEGRQAQMLQDLRAENAKGLTEIRDQYNRLVETLLKRG